MKRAKRVAAGLISLLLILGLTLPLSITAQAEQTNQPRKVVRVGYFSLEGYHEENDSDMKSGYGYDFLQMLARYNNWTYEFIGYDNSWSEMQQMLENGEIDMVTSARKTAERELKFDYSQKDIGSSATIFTTKAGNDKLVVGDVSSYEGARVGMLENNSRNDSFEAFAQENGFTYTPIYYHSADDMASALQEGKDIDAVVSSDLRILNNETILEEFDSSPFYVIVQKGNQELLNEINQGINMMDINTPGWRTDLHNKYYASNTSNRISFSKEELNYLNEVKEEGKVFKVATNPDMRPYSYIEDGKVKGIIPSIFEEIADRVGIQYEYVVSDTYQDYHKLVVDGGVDIDLTCFMDYSLAEKHNIALTGAFMSTSISLVTRSDFDGEVKTVAMVKDSFLQTSYAADLTADKSYVEYNTKQECIDAIINGDVDGMYLYTYSAQYYVDYDVKNRLTLSLLQDYPIELAIGTSVGSDYRLNMVLHRGVVSVKNSFAPQVIQKFATASNQNESVVALFYDKPMIGMVLMGLALIIFFMGIVIYVWVKSTRRQREQAKELSRFMSYVCESNEMVLEINVDTLQCTRHYMKDGELQSENEPYNFADYNNNDNTIHPEDFEKISQEIKRDELETMNQNGGGGKYFEARAKGEDGIMRWYSYTLRAIPSDKKHSNCFILFKKNIDEAKQEEEKQRRILEDALINAKEASEAKGQFLSRMSHEIRTPLNAVIGYMDIAQDSMDNLDKVKHCITNCAQAAKHLLNIINDVLDISSIESGKMKIANEEFDLKEQISTVSTIFFNQAKNKGVIFETIMHDFTEEWVVGDSLRVNQILMNLLSNAIKFTPENGKVTMTISQMGVDDGEVFMKFEVTDTGIGMSPEYLQKLFTPFEQESATTAKKYGGSGLGLSITYNLIMMMGGSIEVHSVQNEGTTFTVLLHFEESSNNIHTLIAPKDYSNVNALIVDDEESSCDYITALLKRCGVQSDYVLDGESAVRQIKRRAGGDYQYDLCIMDWNMPKMNGIETAKKIREAVGDELPIIIATAYDTSELSSEARQLGVTKIISKPLFQSTMFDLLVSTYGKYHPESENKKKSVHMKGMRVLLAEDNEMNLEIAVDVLEKAELVVDTAMDGQEAYDKFMNAKPGTYAAILMDIQMPNVDGYESTSMIRSSNHPEAKSIPIIAMTANAFAEDVSQALANGMNAHISKPINYDKLFNVLAKYNTEKGEQ